MDTPAFPLGDEDEVAALRTALRRAGSKARRRPVPTVLQMEATECGAACLSMILRRHGAHHALERLRAECGVSRDGTNAANLLRAARRLGLEAQGFRRSLPALAEAKLPCIVFWTFNHFVVLEGFSRGRAHVNDPASGPRSMSLEAFDEGFTGVVLELSPGPDFVATGSPPSALAGLARRLGPVRGTLAFIVLASLALVIPGLAVPVLTKVFVDEVLTRQLESWVMPLLIGLALTALVKGALTWLREAQLARLETRIALSQGARFLWHLLRLPVDFFDQRYAGDITARAAANDRVARLLSGRLAASVAELPGLVLYVAVMLAFDPALAGVAVALALVNVAALAAVRRVREDAGRRMLQEQGRLAGVSIAGIQSIETLKATGREDDFFGRWAGHHARYLTAQQRAGALSATLDAVPTLVTGLTIAAVLGLGGLRVMQGAISIGELVAFQSLMRSFSGPIESLVLLGGEVQQAKGDLARIDDVLAHPLDPWLETAATGAGAVPERDDDAPARTVIRRAAPRSLRGRLRIEGLSFGYSRARPPLIEGLDLAVEPGQRVAIIGGSGSGKSTVARLLAGHYRPWSGTIRFDGRPIDEIDRALFTSSVSVVDQSVLLFEGTLRENLTLWDRTVPERAITAALRDAALLDLLERRPGRYDAHVAEGGANFSGGQRQRIEIARALVTDPSVLILDEAMSALDPVTERTIDGNLRRRGCTAIVIAHRLSTVRDADEIIVLDRGRVAERGVHDQLMRRDGAYAALMRTGER